MSQILHIFKKDARHFWPEVLASLVITAIFVKTYPDTWATGFHTSRLPDIIATVAVCSPQPSNPYPVRATISSRSARRIPTSRRRTGPSKGAGIPPVSATWSRVLGVQVRGIGGLERPPALSELVFERRLSLRSLTSSR
jgi:hypothetical protein